MNQITSSLLTLFFAIMFCLAAPSSPAKQTDDSGALVKIDGQTITQEDLNTFFNAFFNRKEVRKRLARLPEFRRKSILARGKGKALEKLIQRNLLLSAAKKDFVKNEKVEKVIDQMTENRLEQIKNSVDSWVGFVRRLHERDVSLREWKDLLRGSILIQNFVHKETGNEIRIRPVEVRRYYEKHRENFRRPRTIVYRFIVVDPQKCGESETPEQLAQKIHQELSQGASFARLAEKYSLNRDETDGGLKRVEAPESRPKWMPPVVQGLEPGELSKVQETDSGYSIARLERVLPSGPKPYQEVQDEIQKRLRNNRRRQVRKKLLDRLRGNATIKVLPAGKRLINE